jgi:hypothetical protein
MTQVPEYSPLRKVDPPCRGCNQLIGYSYHRELFWQVPVGARRGAASLPHGSLQPVWLHGRPKATLRAGIIHIALKVLRERKGGHDAYRLVMSGSVNRRGWQSSAAAECPSIFAAAHLAAWPCSRPKECLVTRQSLHRHLTLRVIREIQVGKRLAVGVLHDEGFLTFLDRPGRREAAVRGHGLVIARVAPCPRSTTRRLLGCQSY